MVEKRQRWSSNVLFLFAAVGSAVGLGNIWRFPYLAGKYGGGAFLIPYLLILFILGIPLLMLEFAVGQRMQKGAVHAFGKIKKWFSGIGIGLVSSGFIVVCYYAVVISWALLYLFHSFSINTWASDTKSFFFNTVLQLSDNVAQIGGIVWPVFLALIIVWIAIYFSIWEGVRSVEKVVIVTMPLPVLLILLLVLRGVTLEGAIDGLLFYLVPNFKALLDWEVWTAATSQIFFTLSLAFGIMIAYASYQSKESDITKNAVLTALLNSGVSIIAGFAVFSTLGFMALKQGVSVSEVAAAGPGLAFVVLPKALSLMPWGVVLFSVLFFITLLTLAIDSAFSLVEAVSATIHDSHEHLNRKKIALFVCIAGFLGGILFTTNAGLYYLDITDHFVTNYGLVFFGLLECLAVGWFYGAEKLRNYLNDVSDWKVEKWWSLTVKYFIPVILVVLLILQFKTDITTPYEGYPTWALWSAGWGIIIALLLVSIVFSLVSCKKNVY